MATNDDGGYPVPDELADFLTGDSAHCAATMQGSVILMDDPHPLTGDEVVDLKRLQKFLSDIESYLTKHSPSCA